MDQTSQKLQEVKVLFMVDMSFPTESDVAFFTEKGITLDCRTESNFGQTDQYNLTFSFGQAITKLTQEGYVDIVVIGHHGGIGIQKAQYVYSNMRHKTAVVWDKSVLVKNEQLYRKVGFVHFGVRKDMRQIICTLLGIT